MFRSTLAVGASRRRRWRVMVVTSLLLVSLRRRSRTRDVTSPQAAKPGAYPRWIAGPTGALTSWFTRATHTERVFFTAAIATMLVAYLVVVYSARAPAPGVGARARSSRCT